MLAWSPIGDNDFVGWFTTIAYVIVAILCWRIWYLKKRGLAGSGYISNERRSSRFWFFIAMVITLLGFNKQPDIQTSFLAACKQIVLAMGWIGVKKKLQLIFVTALAMSIGAFLVMLFWNARDGRGKRYWLAFVGICLLGLFVIIRAALFSHLDRMLGRAGVVLHLDHCLEITGIFAVGIEAALASRCLNRNENRLESIIV